MTWRATTGNGRQPRRCSSTTRAWNPDGCRDLRRGPSRSLADSRLVERVDLQTEGPIAQGFAYVDDDLFLRFYFNESTQTIAFALILQMLDAGSVSLVRSSVTDYENSRNPFPSRRRWVERCLAGADFYQRVDEGIRARAAKLDEAGLRPLDALHLASAEAAESSFFLTCDDRLMNHYKGKLKVMNPVDFVVSEGGEYGSYSDE